MYVSLVRRGSFKKNIQVKTGDSAVYILYKFLAYIHLK